MLTEKLKLYRPLLLIFGASLLGAAALGLHSTNNFGNLLMGLFLLFLAVLQLFDAPGFAMSFRRYDLLAARSMVYARAYPWLELVLALCYLGNFALLATNIVTALVMLIGLLGILRAIRRTEKLHCACAGTAFALPVGWITVLENTVMGAMAVGNLIALLILK